MESLINFIDYLPQYIKYIYPGYITLYIYYFLRGKRLSDSKGIVLKAVIISYIYVSSLEGLNIQSQLQENFWLISVSLIVSYVVYLMIKSESVSHAFESLDIETTFYENEIEALQGLEEGVWLTVYLKDENLVYEGDLHYKEMEEDRRKYITISGYRKYMLDEKGKPEEIYIDDYTGNLEEEVIIFYDDIKRIEKRNTKVSQN